MFNLPKVTMNANKIQFSFLTKTRKYYTILNIDINTYMNKSQQNRIILISIITFLISISILSGFLVSIIVYSDIADIQIGRLTVNQTLIDLTIISVWLSIILIIFYFKKKLHNSGVVNYNNDLKG